MSVVAGCSLLDGIIMGSDCRVTFRCGANETHRDTVQKLIALTPYTVLGFVGNDVRSSATMLKAAVEGARRRQRSDALSLCSCCRVFFGITTGKPEHRQLWLSWLDRSYKGVRT